MPFVSFKSVLCVSSEDKAHPASNLLSNTNKKWKCELKGENMIYTILQFEKSSQITGIDIGNEHSGFIEVFVGRNGWLQENYKEILLASSFMTPLEGRNSTSVNRVRCFAKNALISPVCNEKWDLIKIVCTQPFNRHVQYGLSFVKVYCTEDEPPKSEEKPSWLSTNMIGKFKIREESPDSDADGPSVLFSRWKEEKTSPAKTGNLPSLSAASAIREASNMATSSKYTPTSKRFNSPMPQSSASKIQKSDDEDDSKMQDRNRQSLLYDEEDETTSNPKFERIIIKDRERIEKEKKDRESKANGSKRQSSSKDSPAPKISRDNGKKMEASASKFRSFIDTDVNTGASTSSQSGSKDKAKTSNDNAVEMKLNRSLHNSSTASSIESPKRSKKPEASKTLSSSSKKRLSSPMRDVEPEKKKKKPPPKSKLSKPYSKLLEGVVIVISGIQNPERADIRDKAIRMGARYKPDWVNGCTHLICAFKNTPKYNQVKGKGKIVKKDWIIQCDSQRKRIPWRRHAVDSTEMDYPESEDEIWDDAMKDDDDSSDDDVTILNSSQKSYTSLSSRYSDLENGKDNNSIPEVNVYDLETDEELPNETHSNDDNINASQATTEIFKDKQFYLSGNLGAVDEIKIRRIIVDHSGTICAKDTLADYVITKDGHDSRSGTKFIAVKPLWIYECDSMNRLLPTDRYKK